jgi:hypothetical protein
MSLTNIQALNGVNPNPHNFLVFSVRSMNQPNRKRRLQHDEEEQQQQQDDTRSIGGALSEWSFNFEEEGSINTFGIGNEHGNGNGNGNELNELKLKMAALEVLKNQAIF